MTSTIDTSLTAHLESSTYELLSELRDSNSTLAKKFAQLITDACERSTTEDVTKVYVTKFDPLSNGINLVSGREAYEDLGDNIALLVSSQSIGLVGMIDDIPLTGYIAVAPAEFLRHTLVDGTAMGIERLRKVIVALEAIVARPS